MRAILLIALASIAGYGALQIDRLDPDNYVKMYLGNYVVELKVLQFLILLLLLVVALYFLLWLVRTIWRSPRLFGRWRATRNRNKADEHFGAGYLSLIKGDWSKAETQLTTRSSYSRVPYVNYLAAAQAAQEQGRLEQRDEYLSQAYSAAPAERLAIGLTQAKLQQRAGQTDAAARTLSDLTELGARNPQYTAMSLQLHEQTENWSGVRALLATARKQKALPAEVLDRLQDDIYSNELLEAPDKAAAFKALPRAQRKRLANQAVYARDLVERGETVAAEKLIRSALKQDWDDGLVEIYGRLPVDKPARLLRRVQGWLMARPENAELNLAAGRLAHAAKKMDEAKQYLQAAIAAGQLPAAYALLGEVFEADNESGKALSLYRVGIHSLSEREDQPRESATEPAASQALLDESAPKAKAIAKSDTQEPG